MLKNFLKNKKVILSTAYIRAMDYNDYNKARMIRTRLLFLDELIKEAEKHEQGK